MNIVINGIAHSWFGNVVTIANWENNWLNEGFSTFLERKIINNVLGK